MIQSLIFICATVIVQQPKLPMPDEAAQKVAEKVVLNAYQDDFSSAKTADQKVALAKKLIDEGTSTKDDPTERFMLCRLARDMVGSARRGEKDKAPAMKKTPFGNLPDGTPVDEYLLVNGRGLEVTITNYGATVTRLFFPDAAGNRADIVLGCDTLHDYLAGHPFFGCIVGRYGNRIANGQFTLDGHTYTLAKNNGENHLHGGRKGFDKALWKEVSAGVTDKGPRLVLSYLSPAGEEGYPGNLSVTVTYLLTRENELRIDYQATTDKPTPINLTNHSYFNLKGHGEGDILGHELTLYAERFTPVTKALIPTGELRSVAGTPLDFRKPTRIGERIDADDEQLRFGNGYDHNFVLADKPRELTLAATVFEPTTGRVMEVLTTEPGVQLYCGNFLDGKSAGKGGKIYKRRYGFCLETQHFPDSPNQPKFPTTILKPGQEYRSTTAFRFSVKK